MTWGLYRMAATIRKFQRMPVTVDAAQYDGREDSRKKIIGWVQRHKGTAFQASELLWRQEMGTYYHPQYGFVYLPQGARSTGHPLQPLRDDEIVVRADNGVYVLVFPGDYVVRSRSGFYPLAEESFHRSYVSNSTRRGTIPA